MLCKGAHAPDPPPPPPATPQVDEAGAAMMEKAKQKRLKGLERTQQGTLLETLGGGGSLGASSFQIGKPNPPPPPPTVAERARAGLINWAGGEN